MEQDLPPNHPSPDADPDQPPAPPAGDPPPPPPGAEAGGEPGGQPAGGGGWGPPFQFLRSRQDRKLGGVAGGLAAATGLDPTLVRLAVVLFLLTGWGILGYLVAWVVIPEEDQAKGRHLVPAPDDTAKHIRIGLTVAAALGVLQIIGSVLGVISAAIFGIGLLPFHILGLGDDHGFEAGEAMLGLVLLIGGCLVLFRRHLPWMTATDSGPGAGWWPGRSAGPGSGPDATPSGAASASGPGVALATTTPGGSATSGGYGGGSYGGYGPPASGAAGAGGSFGSGGPTGADGFGARASAAARAARTNGPLLLVRAVGWLVGLWFLAAAVLGGVFWLSGALRVRFPVLPIVAVLAGVGFLGFTLLRSRRVGVVLAAMALLLIPTALAAGVTRVDGQAGDRTVSPMVPTDLERQYRHAVGVLRIDLSNLQLPAGQTPLKVDMGAGQVEITVPWDAEVEARASVTAGSFDLFGSRQTGVNLNGKSRSTGQPGAPVLVITGHAGAGEIIVRRAYEPFTHQALRTGQPVPLACHPSGRAGEAAGSMSCAAADGVTTVPALNCVVSDSGSAMCRPPGEPEPAVDFANDPGTRRCQVPAGSGLSSCTAPIPGSRSRPGGSSEGSGNERTFTCTIPAGGGQSVCRPANSDDSGSEPPPPAPQAPPAEPEPSEPNAPAPTSTVTSGPSAPPGEYRCTVPADGGPTTCEPV